MEGQGKLVAKNCAHSEEQWLTDFMTLFEEQGEVLGSSDHVSGLNVRIKTNFNKLFSLPI